MAVFHKICLQVMLMLELWKHWKWQEKLFQRPRISHVSHISTIYIYHKKATLFVSFGNYSRGILGNHLTANGYQNVKLFDMLEIWKMGKMVAFFIKLLSKVTCKLEQ